MFRRLFIIGLCLWAVLASLAATAQPSGPCGSEAPCEVKGGFYHAYLPAGWDGRPSLKAVMFFHGWREEAKNVLADPAMRDFADRRDVILILPQGEGLTWSFPGSPGKHRDEVAFVEAVLDDVAKRLPVDTARIYAAGFSQGGSMVWNLACHAPLRFAGFMPVAGGFWEPLPEACAPGPRRIFHTHGIHDSTVPMTGRYLRGGLYRQGDIRRGWQTLMMAAACQPGIASFRREDRFACEHMKGCASPAAMELCLFEGGHMMEPAFLDLGLSWMEAEGG
ncbi:MAG: alpha/beta hydrolase family esterase [Bosea sp. (in: a-proteobacteria)]